MRSVGDSAVSLVLVLTAASSLFLMVGLFQIDKMVNQDLYRFHLEFSYAWATPYWTLMRFVFAIGWFNILVAIGFHFYMIRQRKKEARKIGAPMEKEISKQETKPTEKVEEAKEQAVKPMETVEKEQKETQVSVVETEKKEETQTAIAEASSLEQAEPQQSEQVEEPKEAPVMVIESESQEKKEETSSVTEEKSGQEQPPSEQLEQVEEKKEQKPESPAESEGDQKQAEPETQETSEETPIIIGIPEEEPQPTL